MKRRRIACFLALPQHTRFFLPLQNEIERQGGELLFITPLSEYPYELDMMKRKMKYRFFSDYMTPDIRDKVNASLRELFDGWAGNCFKWQGYSRWPLGKQTWLLAESVEEYFCLEMFMDEEKPDMFIAHHECSRWGKIMGHLCFKKAIPFVTFQEGDYYARTMGNAVHTEYSTADLLWGRVTKERLAGYTCSRDKMFPIGNTHIDAAIKEYANSEMRTAIRRDLAIPENKKVVLFLVGIKFAGIKEKEIWQNLMKVTERTETDIVCIFKWHPNVAKKTADEIKEIINELAPSAVIMQSYDPYRLIAIADYCVTLGQTTLTIESVAFGKPMFSVPDPDAGGDDYYVNEGIAQSVYPIGNWTNLISTMENGVPAGIQNRTSEFLSENFYKLDGRSVERAAGVISYIFEVRQKKEKTAGIGRKEFVEGRVSFVIPSGRDAEALLATLTSLSQNVKHRDWEVVIVASDRAIKETLSSISGDVRVIEAEGNLAHLYNTGAEASSGEYLVFMRPGLVYFKGEGIDNAMKDGIAGVPIKNRDMTPYCLGIGFDFNFAPYLIKEDLTLNDHKEAVGGGLIGMHRTIFESVRKFDDGLANHLIEPDICLKAKELNIPVRYLSGCLAFNYKETFFREDVSDENWKNRVKFFARWVGKLPKDDDFLRHAGDLMKV
ncbi:MAG: glycosyltransferase [Dissulfurispiraceae bacterium]